MSQNLQQWQIFFLAFLRYIEIICNFSTRFSRCLKIYSRLQGIFKKIESVKWFLRDSKRFFCGLTSRSLDFLRISEDFSIDSSTRADYFNPPNILRICYRWWKHFRTTTESHHCWWHSKISSYSRHLLFVPLQRYFISLS